MPVLMSHYVMLQRNLIYTGVTRAKKALIIVGTKKALSYAVRHVTVESRNTKLRERIVQTFSGVQPDADTVIRDADAHTAWLKHDLFARLAESTFRSRFHLNEFERKYAEKIGEEGVRQHAADLIAKRLAPERIENDGKQTPMHGHPVFVAQHATGTCCRGCLEKWLGIPKGRGLSDAEKDYIIDVILRWIAQEMSAPSAN